MRLPIFKFLVIVIAATNVDAAVYTIRVFDLTGDPLSESSVDPNVTLVVVKQIDRSTIDIVDLQSDTLSRESSLTSTNGVFRFEIPSDTTQIELDPNDKRISTLR